MSARGWMLNGPTGKLCTSKAPSRIVRCVRSVIIVSRSELALRRERIDVVGHDLARRLEREHAGRVLFHLHGVPVLYRVLIGAELELAARRLKIRLEHCGAEGFAVVDLATGLLEGCIDGQRG